MRVDQTDLVLEALLVPHTLGALLALSALPGVLQCSGKLSGASHVTM